MIAAIEKAFGKNADTTKALVTIVEFSCQPFDYWAKKLTNDYALRSVLIPRAKIDLSCIGDVFSQRYSDGKTLSNWIKDD